MKSPAAKIVENPSPATDTQVPVQRVAAILFALVLSVALACFGLHQLRMSEPYIHEVLSLEGNQEQGHAIFQINCAGCHGLEADGRVGPSLLKVSDHKSRYSIIHQVISGETPPMPKFQPSPQEMADLLNYLEQI